jgi:hypothetical protein
LKEGGKKKKEENSVCSWVPEKRPELAHTTTATTTKAHIHTHTHTHTNTHTSTHNPTTQVNDNTTPKSQM